MCTKCGTSFKPTSGNQLRCLLCPRACIGFNKQHHELCDGDAVSSPPNLSKVCSKFKSSQLVIINCSGVSGQHADGCKRIPSSLRTRLSSECYQFYGILNKEQIALRKKAYAKTPQGKEASRKANSKRRASLKSRSDVVAEHLISLYAEPCPYPNCNTDDPIWIEHIIPLSRGGQDIVSNLGSLCRFHNISKHKKLVQEWKPELVDFFLGMFKDQQTRAIQFALDSTDEE